MLLAHLVLALTTLAGPIQGPAQEPTPPTESGPSAAPLNVLWLTVEDMSPWIGPYGDTTVPTPNLDAFARQAIRYDNAFANSPVCAPARTALITGVHPLAMGAAHMRTRSRSKAAGDAAYGDLPVYEAVPHGLVRCFPETLRAAGYFTTNRAKTDYQFRETNWTWDRNGRGAHYDQRPDGAPFFSVFNHTGTHESQAFPNARRRPDAVALGDVPIPPIYPDTPAVRDAMKRTYDNIAAMDVWFGERLAELEERGLADSTVVFFFSDHGVGLPRGKRSVYGTGTRVPLLVRFPEGRGPDDLPPGSHTNRLVSFIDFAPTVLSLCGVKPRMTMGSAFLGEHEGAAPVVVALHADRFDAVRDRVRARTNGRFLVIHNQKPEEPHIIPNAYRERLPMTHDLYALRDGGDRASERTPAQWQTGSTRRPEWEVYDSASDPWEVKNLASTPEEDIEPNVRALIAIMKGEILNPRGPAQDLGAVEPEGRMVREFLWKGDTQPTTADPRPYRHAEHGPSIVSTTHGASLGWRLDESSPWNVAPMGRVDLPAGVTRIQIQAHRLGYLPSGIVDVDFAAVR